MSLADISDRNAPLDSGVKDGFVVKGGSGLKDHKNPVVGLLNYIW